MKKERVDILCVEQGLFESREKAKRAIMAGLVHNDHERLDKPGMKIPADTVLYVKGEVIPYVSRGGLKLEKALNLFHIDLASKVVLDIGSSTGGFTDCALQHGASFVYALDVGTNQLSWKLRTDERVKSLEKTNFRYATKDLFDKPIEFACTDVSFISLKHIFIPLKNILEDSMLLVALIKPQFEAGKEEVGKHGLVKEKSTHIKVIENVIGYANDNGFSLIDLTYSPITGGHTGNIEYLGCFVKDKKQTQISIEDIVNEAHKHFE